MVPLSYRKKQTNPQNPPLCTQIGMSPVVWLGAHLQKGVEVPQGLDHREEGTTTSHPLVLLHYFTTKESYFDKKNIYIHFRRNWIKILNKKDF